MKNSTRKVIESLPVLEKYLEDMDNVNFKNLNPVEKTFLDLVNFFEHPEKHDFQLQNIYQNLNDDWLLLALNAINLFFEKDTYLMKNATHSIIKEGDDYLNQKEFVDFLNENGENYSEAKMSVYVQRGIIPSPDLILSNTRYWLKSTCEMFLSRTKNNDKGASYNV